MHGLLHLLPISVITLPVVAPLVALLQLLFPGLLGAHWRAYRVAIGVLLTQSSLMLVHWILVAWVFNVPPAWLGEDSLGAAVVVVAALGVVLAAKDLRRPAVDPLAAWQGAAPARIEYLALGTLAGVGILWAGYQTLAGTAALDSMAAVTAASLAALAHLAYRRTQPAGDTANRTAGDTANRTAGDTPPRRPISTQFVFLVMLALTGAGVEAYVHADGQPRQSLAASVTEDWPMYRGNPGRTGTADPAGPDIQQPAVLWQFDPSPPRGRVSFHASPTVVDGQLYIGALYQVLHLFQGQLYCLGVDDGRPTRPGEVLWRVSDGQTKPVFSSPSIAEDHLYVGEGYHQDTGCRVLCLDARDGNRLHWSHRTASHVESSPTIHEGRVFVGAGDDGLLCLDPGTLEDSHEGPRPKLLWQVPGIHVDSSPLVHDGGVFVGTVAGDVYRELLVVCADVASGSPRWRVPTPLPVPGTPALGIAGIVVGLGNGKLDHDVEAPAGGVLCLETMSGRQVWKFPTRGAVFGPPVCDGDDCIFTCRDGACYRLSAAGGDLLWRCELGEPIAAAPVVTEHSVYVLTTAGTLARLDRQRGEVVWRLESLRGGESDAYAAPTLAGGRLYVPVGGRVYCIAENLSR